MTEHDLTALAKMHILVAEISRCVEDDNRKAAYRKLDTLDALIREAEAERDALTMASDVSVTNARLALNDWHQCSTQEELARWRAAQARLIIAAKASVKPEVDALLIERDALKAQLEELQELLNDAEVNAEGRSHDG